MRQTIPMLFYALAVVIHGVPALSAFAPKKMASLYGISADDQVLMTLLQHRALLFGLVAAACIYAAHTPSVRWPVLIGTAISMSGFTVIAATRGELGGSLNKIVLMDGFGILLAAVIAVLLLRT